MSAEIKIVIDAYAQSNSLKTANTELERMVNNFKELNKVQSAKVKSSSNIIDISKEVEEQRKLVAATEKQKAAINDVAVANAKAKAPLAALTIEQQKQRLAIAEANKESKETAKLQMGLYTAYQKASKALNENRNAYKNLALQGRENGKVGRALIQTINEQDARLKKLDATVGQHQRNVGNYSSALSGLKERWMGVAAGFAAFAGAFAFLKKGWDSFLEAEHNAKQLGFAIKNVGGEGEVAFRNLLTQSEELQKKGIFSDDAIQQAQTQLANYGLSSKAIEELIPKIADMAAATGKDLGEATSIAIKGISGQTKGLKMLGIDYKDTGDKAKNLALLTDQLTKFQGANAEQLETVAGKTERLKNAWDDLMESVGEGLVNQGTLWLDFYDILTGKLSLTEKFLGDVNSRVMESMSESTREVVSKLTGTIEEQTKAIDKHIKTRKESATQATRDYEAGKLSATSYQAIALGLTQQVKDLEAAKKSLTKAAVTDLSGDDDAKKVEAATKKHIEDLWALRLRLMDEGREKELLANELAFRKEIDSQEWTLKERNLLIELYNKQEFEINKKYDDLALKQREEFYLKQRKLAEDAEKKKNDSINALRKKQDDLVERNTIEVEKTATEKEMERYQKELDELESMRSEADALDIEATATYNYDKELLEKKHAENLKEIDKGITEEKKKQQQEQLDMLEEFGDKLSEAALQKSERDLSAIEKKISEEDSAIEYQRQRAIAGQENDLAQAEQRKAELERIAIAEQKKQEKIKQAQAYWTLFMKFAESDSEQAAQKAALEIAEGIAISALFAEKGGMGEDLKEKTTLGVDGFDRSHGSGDMLTMISPKEGILTEQNISTLGGKDGFYALKHNLEMMANNPLSDNLFAKQNESFSNVALVQSPVMSIQPLIDEIKELRSEIANKPVSSFEVDGLGNYIHTIVKKNSRVITDKGSFIKPQRKKFID